MTQRAGRVDHEIPEGLHPLAEQVGREEGVEWRGAVVLVIVRRAPD